MDVALYRKNGYNMAIFGDTSRVCGEGTQSSLGPPRFFRDGFQRAFFIFNRIIFLIEGEETVW